MTNEQILNQTIDKAVKSGFSPAKFLKKNIGKVYSSELIIFDHDLAKAIWGEENCMAQVDENNRWHDTSCCSAGGCFFRGKIWQYHLQQMVLLSNNERFKYLKKFL